MSIAGEAAVEREDAAAAELAEALEVVENE